jgi:hypothetical protein
VSDSPTFYTISDAPYFPGTAALVNSLRLTGNEGRVVVLDRGLTPEQRERLEPHAAVVDVAVERPAGAYVYKAFPHLLDARGIVVVIDSDIIVTRSLDDLVRCAELGRICVFADHPALRERWFAEWHETLGLQAPLRRQTYVNSGFVAVSTAHWPHLLARWWELCALVSPEAVFAEGPFWAADQDVLNALLASEIPADAIEIAPDPGEAYVDDHLRVRVDLSTLACTLDGDPVTLLHHGHAPSPKVWLPGGWLRLRLDAYVRLLRRLLFADDVPLRLEPEEVPLWVRPSRAGRLCARSLDAAHGGLRSLIRAMPVPLRLRLQGLRDRVYAWLTD